MNAERKQGIIEGLEMAAQIADAFEDENFSMCYDTILFDPVMHKEARTNGHTLTAADVAKSEALQIEGTIHSSMAHAARNMAEAIRAKVKELSK